MRRPERTINTTQLQSMTFAAALAAHKEHDPKFNEFYTHFYDIVALIFNDAIDSPVEVAIIIYNYITNNLVADGASRDPETAVDEWRYKELTDLLLKCFNIRVAA